MKEVKKDIVPIKKLPYYYLISDSKYILDSQVSLSQLF